MVDCEPTYTNQGEGTFADGEYVTTDMLRKFCRSLAYLKEMTDILETEVDPQLNKVFVPLDINPSLSYGMVLNGNNYTLSDQQQYTFVQLFNRIDPITGLEYPASPGIDINQTNAYVDLEYPISGEQGHGAVTLHPLSTLTTSLYDYEMSNYYRGPNDNESLNVCWEIGWDKTKPYNVSAKTKADRFNAKIPSIARAVVFGFTGADNRLITDVTIKPSGTIHAEDELYLELRTVSNGKPTSTVLARTSAKIRKFTEVDLLSFAFPFPVRVRHDTEYAIVVRSPLTTYKHRFGMGGWTFHCGTGAHGQNASTHGNVSNNSIYTSYDNGHTWMAHGKVEDLSLFKHKNAEPADFLFEVETVAEKVENVITYTSGERVYLNPIRTNPVTSVELLADANTTTGQSIVYEIATDLAEQNWQAVNSGDVLTFNTPYPRTLYVRATLNSNSTSSTPVLKMIALNLNTTPAMKGVIRSNLYRPPTSMPLGMTMWSKVNAPYTEDPNTSVLVDIMESNLVTDRFVEDASTPTFQLTQMPADPLEFASLTLENGTEIALLEDQDYTVDYNTGIVTMKESLPSMGRMELERSVFASGTLEFEYYPLFARGLTSNDFPYRCDYREETITPTDFATETQVAGHGGQIDFILEDSTIQYLFEVAVNGTSTVNYTVDVPTNTLSFNTGLLEDDVVVVTYNGFSISRVADPIILFEVNGNTIIEHIDYDVNYMTNMVTIHGISSPTDIMTIGYTPYLNSDGLALNYRVTRSNTEDNVLIGPSEYQYRV